MVGSRLKTIEGQTRNEKNRKHIKTLLTSSILQVACLYIDEFFSVIFDLLHFYHYIVHPVFIMFSFVFCICIDSCGSKTFAKQCIPSVAFNE